MNEHEWINMDHLDIWSAVEAGDINKLQELINYRALRQDEIGKLTIGNPWALLLLAIISRNLEVVKLVTEYFEPDPGAANEQGVTPILLACREECPVEMIIYLMEHSVQNDSVSALEFAVFNNCVDLAKALITYEANYNALLAKTFTTALYLAITRTGNLELLQYMLDAPNNAVYSFVTEKYGEFTGLEEFARKASYELEKKITCFKILFNVLHSNAYTSDPVRYNVNDILRVALLSSETTSLIPYFIETERQWETRPLISSLYERLLPNYGLLALTVLCTCGPITIDKEELDPILKGLWHVEYTLHKELQQMFANAIQRGNEEQSSSMVELQLLEDFASYTETETIKFDFFHCMIHNGVMEAFCDTSITGNELYKPSFHRAIECMLTMFQCSADNILELLFALDGHENAIMVFAMLRYSTLLIRPEEIDIHEDDIRLLHWFLHLFGSWKVIQQHVGKPILQVFTLQRFARDAVREAIWYGVKELRTAKFSFYNRLLSLEIPKQLTAYLTYCDCSSTKYFLIHIEAVKDFMNNETNRPYPVII